MASLPESGDPFVRLRPHLQWLRDGPDVLLIGDGCFRVCAEPALLAALDRLRPASGVRRSQFLAAGGETAREFLKALIEGRLAQLSERPFSSGALPGTAAYLSALTGHAAASPPLEARSICIIGCGGVGGELARHLAASGIGSLRLVDPDVVSAANLNRQYLFSLADVNRPKVDVAREALLGLAPGLRIATYRRFIREASDLADLGAESSDAVVCCADIPLGVIHRLVAEYARSIGALFAMATVGVDQGSWGPIVHADHRPTYLEWTRAGSLPTLERAIVPPIESFGPTNSWVAAALATDLIHVLAGAFAPSVHCRLVIDFHTLAITRTPLEAGASA
jgi:hypothetical protein